MNRLSTFALLFGVCLSGCKRGEPGASSQSAPPTPRTYTGDQLPAVEMQGTPEAGGVLRIGMEAEPPSLNPQLDPLDGWGRNISYYLYESMARPDAHTWGHEPRLAERWDISDDKLTFTFYLRKGVRWHDGEPFSADDVIFTFDKLFDTHCKTISMRSFLEPIERYEKLDAHTVRFTLRKRYWYAFDAIAEIFIYPKHVFEGGDFNTHPANRAPVGTGRYRFGHWKTGDEIVLVRNDGYYGRKAYLDKLVFKYAPDPTVRAQLLQRGELDVAERVSPEQWARLAEEPAIAAAFWRLRHVPDGVQWIGWNQSRPMFRDARVRRALTMLIDRGDIVQNLRLGLDMPAASWFYPGSKQYNTKLAPLPYDPKRAIELLEQAGWKDTNANGTRDKDGVELALTFLYPAGNPLYEQLASLMQNDFGKVGIAVETSRLEWAVYTERLRKHEFDACSLVWKLEPRSDPWQIWHSSSIGGGSNWVSFRNVEADRLMQAAREEFDVERRAALYHRFSEILHQEQPYTLLFNRYNLSLVSKRFGGVYSTPYGLFRYDDFFLRRDAVAAGE